MIFTHSFPTSKKWILSLIMCLDLLAFVTTAESPSFRCNDSGGNGTSTSIYDTNLNALLSSVLTNISDNGFYNASFGQNPDRANIIVLCRGDTTLESCRSCVETAATELVTSCPNKTQALIIYELCTLRHSNRTILGIPETNPTLIVSILQNATSSDQFLEDRRTLMENLRLPAAGSGSLRKVAAANRSTSDFQTIYGLVQCTPDLSSDDCNKCIARNTAIMPNDCLIRIMCRVFNPSCNVRYEIDTLFYNETRIREFLVAPPPVAMPPVPPLAPPALQAPPGKKDDNTSRILVIIIVSLGACLLLSICFVVLLRKRGKHNLHKDAEIHHDVEDTITTSESLLYDFEDIRVATNDFSDTNKLGEGGFGAVYKGFLQNGREIAVKRLSATSDQGDLEFKNEILLVAKLQHRNLVRILGFSIQRNERILVYEFIQNASLDRFIFDPLKRLHLDWERRYKIIVGVAKGILYLHEDSRIKIIHRDLKASNVLLDSEMNPKIADFGMAWLFSADETQANTNRIVGTYGYMAPEYAKYGQFSVKSDVFSFGVLVLEIISGRKNNSFQNEEIIEHLIISAWKLWLQGTSTNLIDPVLRVAGTGNMRDMLRCIHIGLLCVQDNNLSRPTMASVVLMFSSLSMTLPVPSKPAFFVSSGSIGTPLVAEHQSKCFESSENNKSAPSTNDMSISEPFPR